jgi:cytoskeletal protein CcmA (bactofilin family)
MWKRDDAAKPAAPAGSGPAPTPTPAPASPVADIPATRPTAATAQPGLEKSVNIGKSVVIKGELNGSEDLTIEGQVEGKIELRQNVLTIGPNGKIKAQVFAKAVIILGEVTGNVTATEKVDIRDNGSVDGDITAPRVAIAEGAHFRGSIDMQRAGAKATDGKGGDTKGGDAKGSDAKPAASTTPASSSTPTPAGAAR